ncbi:sec-independent protein translocase protein TATA, chloroplastic-like [Elaeis guineensis]|uniref:LOW QUALITY PROTEIN: sec-independent protein translocase protein TATA, chloroplastic-like n=1 Tax=Elaeis guineensis var. tenera TaxID=51953 RepID=A0A6I9SAC4_ELAGV|nr:LOW QUALITY PROTEIN: sec-independent protein translocase protein TATA, chloroplastic-like [Elaeis guineensis]
MEMARCSTSLMASRLPARPPTLPHASLAASSSVFFTNGGKAVVGSRLAVVARRRRRASGGLGCRCLFGLGVPELVVIAGVAALVFGPKKLPEIGRSIGKTVKSFQQAAKEFETELKKDGEDASKPPPPAESPKAVSSEDEKKELEASGTKETS